MLFSDLVTPSWVRWNAENPPRFTIWLNILYACAGGFMSANLYYSHPILDVLAHDFNTTQAGVANIPTLSLAGDATGLLLVLPLADFFPRRQFALMMMSLAAIFWIGLCITQDLTVFSVLTYLSAIFTGVPQIMLPLVSELSTDENRAFNISIVAAGPTLAILLARILSGIVANYIAWRNVYWLALALQGSVIIALWLFMPDYPATNEQPKRQVAKTYPKILWNIVTLYAKYPVLVQVCIMSFCTFFAVGSFWTTLTFLLSESPYNYNTFIIGLFGLIGAATMVLGPLYGKYIIQPIGTPLISAIIGKFVTLTAVVVGTFAGRHSVAGPVIEAVLLDAGLMILQIANRVAIHPIEPKGRNRVNTAFVVSLYLGMLCGAKVSNVVYEQAGGWVASGCLSIGVVVFSIGACFVRGPHEQGWIGWKGGWSKKEAEPKDTEKAGAAEAQEKDVGMVNDNESKRSSCAASITGVETEKGKQ